MRGTADWPFSAQVASLVTARIQDSFWAGTSSVENSYTAHNQRNNHLPEFTNHCTTYFSLTTSFENSSTWVKVQKLIKFFSAPARHVHQARRRTIQQTTTTNNNNTLTRFWNKTMWYSMHLMKWFFFSVQFSGILDADPCWTSVSRSLVGFPMGEKEHGIMGFPYAGRGATYLLVRVVIPVRFG